MGIVNVTPDSFSDGGRWLAVDAAIDHALRLVDDGADVLDIGGESTRPGAAPVDMDEECRRILPVVERLAGRTSVPISIDTTKGEVARRALGAGARIVNDISGLAADPEMPRVCARADCGVIAMHMQGTPQTMQLNPSYGDVVREVRDYLCGRLEVLTAAGISAERIVLDPGVGFGKTALHNLQLLRNLRSLHELGRPILIGHSRKRFLEKVLGRPLEERLAGTIGVAIAVAQQGAELIRVHDVRAVIDGLAAWRAIQGPDDGHPDEA
ncbi:MAG: dihydropteroate synthase [Planctomyces sp.]|nr:dihydropteroate synthase [Planctomyces sp.]